MKRWLSSRITLINEMKEPAEFCCLSQKCYRMRGQQQKRFRQLPSSQKTAFFLRGRDMREYPTLVGQRFGMLEVVEQAPSTESGQRRWGCQCDCGSQTVVLGSNLKRGLTTSCGCKRRKDLTGQHIGHLTVLRRSDRYGSRGKWQLRL